MNREEVASRRCLDREDRDEPICRRFESRGNDSFLSRLELVGCNLLAVDVEGWRNLQALTLDVVDRAGEGVLLCRIRRVLHLKGDFPVRIQPVRCVRHFGVASGATLGLL